MFNLRMRLVHFFLPKLGNQWLVTYDDGSLEVRDIDTDELYWTSG